jgi:tRNA(adenine34) deaminase
MSKEFDEKFMKMAIGLAKEAYMHEEVPIGAVIVQKDTCIAHGFNTKIRNNSPLMHAEINAINDALKISGKTYLDDMTLYVTLEPCIMCAGAIIQARIARLVFGSFDEKGGAFGSLYDLSKDDRLNHRIELTHGILRDECQFILKAFFRQIRENKK